MVQVKKTIVIHPLKKVGTVKLNSDKKSNYVILNIENIGKKTLEITHIASKYYQSSKLYSYVKKTSLGKQQLKLINHVIVPNDSISLSLYVKHNPSRRTLYLQLLGKKEKYTNKTLVPITLTFIDKSQLTITGKVFNS